MPQRGQAQRGKPHPHGHLGDHGIGPVQVVGVSSLVDEHPDPRWPGLSVGEPIQTLTAAVPVQQRHGSSVELVPPARRAAWSAGSWLVGLWVAAGLTTVAAFFTFGALFQTENYLGDTEFNAGAGIGGAIGSFIVWVPWLGVFSVAKTYFTSLADQTQPTVSPQEPRPTNPAIRVDAGIGENFVADGSAMGWYENPSDGWDYFWTGKGFATVEGAWLRRPHPSGGPTFEAADRDAALAWWRDSLK